jgi:N-6 DNA methylase
VPVRSARLTGHSAELSRRRQSTGKESQVSRVFVISGRNGVCIAMAARKKAARPVPPPSVGLHAQRIAESVEKAWHRSYGSGRLDVPLSVVATLAAAPQQDSAGNDSAEVMTRWTADDFLTSARKTWTTVIQVRPEITPQLYPLVAWIFEDPSTELRTQAHATAQAALRAGQVDLTGTDRRFQVDLLGTVLTVLRSTSALKARGQFYTPADVAALVAHMSIVEENCCVEDPMMGTGGMFRAVAAAMRTEGRDPRTIQWLGCDIDEIAVACATVNSMIWGLGDDIVFHAGNALTDDWKSAALAQRDSLRGLASDIKVVKHLFALLDIRPEK